MRETRATQLLVFFLSFYLSRRRYLALGQAVTHELGGTEYMPLLAFASFVAGQGGSFFVALALKANLGKFFLIKKKEKKEK